jgi:hypothetical protein
LGSVMAPPQCIRARAQTLALDAITARLRLIAEPQLALLAEFADRTARTPLSAYCERVAPVFRRTMRSSIFVWAKFAGLRWSNLTVLLYALLNRPQKLQTCRPAPVPQLLTLIGCAHRERTLCHLCP